MKLFYNPPSPYARKVLVTAHEKGIAEKIELYKVDPWIDPNDLLAATPLAKVPALVTDKGLVTESTIICERLDQMGDGPSLLAPDRMEVLQRTGLAQGLIDAAFASVIERRRPKERQWDDWVKRQHSAIQRALPMIAVPPVYRFDLGDISIACALAYLDFRVSEMSWRKPRPELAAWLDEVSERPSMQSTRPS